MSLSFEQGMVSSVASENLYTFTKSLSLSVSKIPSTIALAKSARFPVIDPELSTKITKSLGEVAAEMYHDDDRKSCRSLETLGRCQTEDMSSGGHAIATKGSSDLPVTDIVRGSYRDIDEQNQSNFRNTATIGKDRLRNYLRTGDLNVRTTGSHSLRRGLKQINVKEKLQAT